MEGLGSDIFNRQKNNGENREKRSRMGSVDDNNDAYKKNRSQIVF